MIKLTFSLGGEVAEIIIDGNNLFFYDTSSQMTTTIEGLKLSKSGVIKEFPDLRNDIEWKSKAIERFKEHVRRIADEKDKKNYIKEELKKFGWKPLYWQKAGWRQKKFNNEK